MNPRVALSSAYYFANCIVAGDGLAIILTAPLFLVYILSVLRLRHDYVVPQDMLWLVVYFLFVIGPLQSIDDGYIGQDGPVSGTVFGVSDLVIGAAIPLIFFTVVSIVMTGLSEQRKAATNYVLAKNSLIVISIGCLASFLIYLLAIGGLANLVAARSEKTLAPSGDFVVIALSFQLIFTFLLCLAWQSLGRQRSMFENFILLIALGLLLLSQNPYNAARYYMVAAWLPVAFILLSNRIRPGIFFGLIFFSLLVLMPVFSLTSRFGVSLDVALENVSIRETFFRIPYIDVYDMLVYLVSQADYVAELGPGMRTVGALLFFIPRSYWLEKPTLIAVDLGEQLVHIGTAGTENLSMFIGGELYLDFGLIGVAIGAALFTASALTLARARYWSLNNTHILALIFMASCPIILRGPFGANAPLLLSQCVALFLIMKALAFAGIIVENKAHWRSAA